MKTFDLIYFLESEITEGQAMKDKFLTVLVLFCVMLICMGLYGILN